jgi:hypothetical protein
MGRRLALLLGVALVTSACYGQIQAPPRPSASRVPTIVGELAAQEPDGVYRLRDGLRVTIGAPSSGGPPAAAQLSDRGVWLPQPPTGGGLVLYGEDAAGPFWASTEPDNGTGCFTLHGQGYFERDVGVHLSSGLVLPFAIGGRVHNPRAANQTDPAWILAFDNICLDRNGHVTLVDQLPLGA